MPAGVLEVNLGVPLVVVGLKSDMVKVSLVSNNLGPNCDLEPDLKTAI